MTASEQLIKRIQSALCSAAQEILHQSSVYEVQPGQSLRKVVSDIVLECSCIGTEHDTRYYLGSVLHTECGALSGIGVSLTTAGHTEQLTTDAAGRFVFAVPTSIDTIRLAFPSSVDMGDRVTLASLDALSEARVAKVCWTHATGTATPLTTTASGVGKLKESISLNRAGNRIDFLIKAEAGMCPFHLFVLQIVRGDQVLRNILWPTGKPNQDGYYQKYVPVADVGQLHDDDAVCIRDSENDLVTILKGDPNALDQLSEILDAEIYKKWNDDIRDKWIELKRIADATT